MADEAEHSLFSASGAEGWSWCHGKPALEDGRKTSSSYADEGTAAHTLASWVLESRLKGGNLTAEAWAGEKITVPSREPGKPPRVFVVGSKMIEHVDDYVDRFMFMTQARSVERFVEQRVYYADALGVPRDKGFGTSDGVAILFNQPELEVDGRVFPAGDELQVHDLKYGAGVLVTADTLQMFLYGVGTLDAWDHIADFTRVRLVIHQPRKEHLDELVVTPEELRERVRSLRPAVPRVIEAWGLARMNREAGSADMAVGEALHARGFLKPGEKACRFCDAQAVCPAKIEEVGEALTGRRVSADDFEDLTVDTPAQVREYGGNYLAAAYARLEAIEHWAKAVRAEIDRRVLLKGETFDGVKVVAGKKGKREWTDQAAAEALAMAAPKPIRELLYKLELKTPTQIMDKALKNSPIWAAKFAGLITQAEGKPAVVSTADARPSISHKSLAEQFEDLTAEEDQPAPMGFRAGRERHPFR